MDCLHRCICVFMLLFLSGASTETIVHPAVFKVNFTATIYCQHSTVPALTILSWYRANELGIQVGDVLVTSPSSPQNGRYSLDTATEGNGILNIEQVVKDDAGNYRCSIAFIDGTFSNAFSSLTVQYLDIPTVSLITSPVLSGINAELSCSMPDSVPTSVTFSWFKDDVVLDLGSDRYTTLGNNPNLTINMVNMNDTGAYGCKVENSAFSGNDGRRSSNTEELEVYYITITSFEWIDGAIKCQADGNPTPTVTISVDSVEAASDLTMATANAVCSEVDTVMCDASNGQNENDIVTASECQDACESSPCENNGVCTSAGSSAFACECSSGFSGNTCQNTENGSIVGLVVGCIFGVIAVVVIVIVIAVCCRRSKNKYSHENVGYSTRPADIDIVGNVSREPLKTSVDAMPGMNTTNRDLQKSNEKLFDAREDGGQQKAVGVMI